MLNPPCNANEKRLLYCNYLFQVRLIGFSFQQYLDNPENGSKFTFCISYSYIIITTTINT